MDFGVWVFRGTAVKPVEVGRDRRFMRSKGRSAPLHPLSSLLPRSAHARASRPREDGH